MSIAKQLKHDPLFIPTLLVGAVMVLNMYVVELAVFGSLGLAGYITLLGVSLGKRIPKLKTAREQAVWGMIAFLAGIIVLNAAAYYLFAITKITVALTTLLPLFVFFFPPQKNLPHQKKQNIKKGGRIVYLILAYITFDIGLLFALIGNRTTDLLRSPWHALEPKFFLIYAAATALLFYIISTAKKINTSILLSSLHFFITLSIAAILYPLGFGFDAFVHRATEEWIFLHGFIEPKTPYYIGQYGLVAWLRHLTGIPLFYIDVYLVPILASLTLPAVVGISLKKWGIPLRKALLVVWTIPFVPFLTGYLNLTTPFNLAFLFGIITVFATLLYLKNRLPPFIPAILALAALTTHALVGAPLILFVAASRQIKRSAGDKKAVLRAMLIAMTIIVLAVPALFALRNILLGLGFPTLNTSLGDAGHFFSLFKRPYWFAKSSPFVFELLYAWSRIIVPAAVLLSCVGFFIKKEKITSLFFASTALALLLSAWLLRSWIVFPDVASYEQGDFPLRLVKMSMLFLMPFAMYAVADAMRRVAHIKQKNISYAIRACFVVGATIILTLSLYLSYPQHNPKARFPGLNVTASDFHAVEWIHAQHETNDYIVLANQLVSAAALTKYSFIQYFDTPSGPLFYYSVPTGGPLYKAYGRMLYEEQKREYMEATMELAGVDTAYFVVNSYWGNSRAIIEGAKQSADAWQNIDDDAIWIFIYKKK